MILNEERTNGFLIEALQAVFEPIIRKVISEQLEGKGGVSSRIELKGPANRKEAAKFLGVSVPTLDVLIKTNQLKAYNIGKQIRINWNDLESFIDEKGGNA